MNFLTKWFSGLFFNQESFKHNNKNQIIAMIFETMNEDDVKTQASVIKELYSWSFDSPNLSLLGKNIILMLGSSDSFVINVAFQAATVFLTSTSCDVDHFPSVLIRNFKNPLTISSALHALTFLINPFIYSTIRSELIEIASSSTDINRRYALTSIFVAYKRDGSKLYLPDLLLLIGKAIYVPALRYTAASILCEIAQDSSIHSQLSEFTKIIITELPLSSFYLYSKFSLYLRTILPSSPNIVKQLKTQLESMSFGSSGPLDYFSSYPVVSKLIDTLLLLREFPSGIATQLTIDLSNKLYRLTETSIDPNIQLLSMITLQKVKPLPNFIHKLISINDLTTDPSIIAECSKIQCISSKDKRKDLTNIINGLATTPNIDLALFALNQSISIFQASNSDDNISTKSTNPSNISNDTQNPTQSTKNSTKNQIDNLQFEQNARAFATVLFALHELNNEIVNKALSNAVQHINDTYTKGLILQVALDRMFEPPDDEFGFALASVVSEIGVSKNCYKWLIPPTIAQKREKYQNVMVDCLTLFWTRTGIKIPHIYVNRLILLTQMQSREIRIKASQLINLVLNS